MKGLDSGRDRTAGFFFNKEGFLIKKKKSDFLL